MVLTLRNDFGRYKIQCPNDAEVKVNHHGTDYLIVHEDGIPIWLWDDFLIDLAESGECGLSLLSVVPLN